MCGGNSLFPLCALVQAPHPAVSQCIWIAGHCPKPPCCPTCPGSPAGSPSPNAERVQYPCSPVTLCLIVPFMLAMGFPAMSFHTHPHPQMPPSLCSWPLGLLHFNMKYEARSLHVHFWNVNNWPQWSSRTATSDVDDGEYNLQPGAWTIIFFSFLHADEVSSDQQVMPVILSCFAKGVCPLPNSYTIAALSKTNLCS